MQAGSRRRRAKARLKLVSGMRRSGRIAASRRRRFPLLLDVAADHVLHGSILTRSAVKSVAALDWCSSFDNGSPSCCPSEQAQCEGEASRVAHRCDRCPRAPPPECIMGSLLYQRGHTTIVLETVSLSGRVSQRHEVRDGAAQLTIFFAAGFQQLAP